jgi:hypothetical protein
MLDDDDDDDEGGAVGWDSGKIYPPEGDIERSPEEWADLIGINEDYEDDADEDESGDDGDHYDIDLWI